MGDGFRLLTEWEMDSLSLVLSLNRIASQIKPKNYVQAQKNPQNLWSVWMEGEGGGVEESRVM